MLNAIIIDNERPAIDILKYLLEKTKQVNVVGCFMNAADAFSNFHSLKPDVAFIDIELPEITGLQLAENFKSAARDMEIIFVTAYSQYALQAFRVNALDYLLKPLSYEDIEQAVIRLSERKRMLSASIPQLADCSRIFCFGRLTTYGKSSEKPVKWRTSKAEELFAFMVQNLNKEVSKWKICEALWPECDLKKVDMYLHTTIYKMKRVLQSANIDFGFSFNNGRYRLFLPEIFIDTAEFDSAVADFGDAIAVDAIHRYEKAFLLYKGDYLEENGYIWCLPKAEEYSKKYRNLAFSLVSNYMTKEAYPAVERVLHEVLSKYPLDEYFNEVLLKLYFIRKDRVAFTTHYNTIKTLYRTDLGITPSKSMQDMYNNILKF